MQCPKCQFENPADSLFCGECGSSLEVTCPNCGAKPPANFKFCNKCGQRLREISKSDKAVPQPSDEGKTEPVQVYKVLPSNEKPKTIGHLSGVRAELVNRRAEMAELKAAIDLLQKGRTTIFSICGDAGTGKSRLMEEFKDKLNLDVFQWLEGHAYRQMSQSEGLESQKAEEHLNKAIELAIETKAKGLLGPVYLDLGLLHQAEKRTEKAKECFSKAIHVFKECGANSWLEKYEKELATLS